MVLVFNDFFFGGVGGTDQRKNAEKKHFDP